MVADDDVGAAVDRGAAELPLVVVHHDRDVPDALVEGDDDHLGRLPQREDVRTEQVEALGRDERVDARRPAGPGVVELVVRQHVERGGARLA